MALLRILAVTLLMFLFSGCSPEIGSDAWCKELKEKPKGDWTANQAADYARHCIF